MIATRNRATVLAGCLESLIHQDFSAGRYEIIVVDDGSGDKTPEVVAEIRARVDLPVLRYLRSECRGPNAARNAGLNAAIGDPIVLVDDDALAPDAWLATLVHGVLRHQDADCLGGPVRLRLEGKQPPLCIADRLDGEFDLGGTERLVDFVCSCNMALRRVAIEKAGLFSDLVSGFGDEAEWELRLLKAGGKIVYLPEPWLWHRRTETNLRLGQLARSWFRRGKERAVFAAVVGNRMTLHHELRPIPGFLAHAVRRWCAAGLLSASRQAGCVWGILSERGRRNLRVLKSIRVALLAWVKY